VKHFALLAALKAGFSVAKNAHFQRWQKADGSLLTSADMAANEAIFEVLARSNLPVCSEEGTQGEAGEVRKKGEFWLVDPLDGTSGFVRGNGEWCICVALVSSGKPALGVVYSPILQKAWVADVLKGEFEVFGSHELAEFCEREGVAREFSEFGKSVWRGEFSNLFDVFKTPPVFLAGKRDATSKAFVRAFGLAEKRLSSALKFALLAEGKSGVFVRSYGSSLWDTAAGEAVLAASGGGVFAFNGEALDYTGKETLNPNFIALSKSQIYNLDKYIEFLNKIE